MGKIDANHIGFFIDLLGREKVLESESMKNHTTFRIGGEASVMLLPSSTSHVSDALAYALRNGLDTFVMGNGSNLLVTDSGIDNVVIKIGEGMSSVEIEECEDGSVRVRAQAGILLSRLSSLVAESGLGGFEFASGIPGTLGGAVFMNAGAYGGEMKDVVARVTAVDSSGRVTVLEKDELEFGYRTSIFGKKGLAVVEVELAMGKDEPSNVKAAIADLTEKRTSKQPLDMPSAGSTFKRPEGYFAGKLIEDSGLRGLRHRGAQVSEKHCGFIVNAGGATCEDVLELIRTVQKTVYDRFGVKLETEVKIVGEGE